MKNYTSASDRLFVCNCQRTMEIDGAKLAKGLGLDEALPVHQELCRAGIESVEKALDGDGCIHIACTQEAPLFASLADELESQTELRFTNIRETAGWAENGADALPKIAALISEASFSPEMTSSITLKSEGICIVYGSGQQALEAAERIKDRLSPILVLADAGDAIPPARAEFPIFSGRIKAAQGALGNFQVTIEKCAQVQPSSRQSFTFDDAVPRQSFDCDLILDLSGGTPLFTGHDRRDGYLRVDPGDPAGLANELFDFVEMVGEFEKPRYISFDAGICAHSRSGLVGCTNCLEVCPLGAISPGGDAVSIDPAICGGCGNCASVCPTGAASYALPYRSDFLKRTSVLLDAYAKAGGKSPVLLAHDEKHGAELVAAMARFGRGLPANVIPLALNSVMSLGHDMMSATLALGAERFFVLASPKHVEELDSLTRQSGLANNILEALGYDGPRVEVLAEVDPDAVEAVLHDAAPLQPMTSHRLTGVGTKREVARSIFAQLHQDAPNPQDIIDLPAGAPYGRLAIDVENCTLCLSCVSACPSNALRDNPDKPQLSFVEQACVQCGICVATCPEKVIALEPRYNFTSQALSPEVIKTEEPFHCIECGKAFGAKSSITKVVDKLRGHSMFKDESQLRLIQMCDNCRVVALATSKNDPFAMGERPRVRTTDDYLSEGADKPANGKKPNDFLS